MLNLRGCKICLGHENIDYILTVADLVTLKYLDALPAIEMIKMAPNLLDNSCIFR
jgi:hypothetical protein